jgi:deazaflavin-dependent oxidoreductase (nitroreductase family)
MTTDAQSWEEQLIADLRANGGRPSQGPLAGDPLLLMYTTGTKSGLRRRSILTYSSDGDAYFVAGSNSGRETNPSWIANVSADPNVTIEVANKEFPATATVLDGAERDEAWDRHVAQLPRFADYPAQITGRTIPMVRLTAKAAAS